ncbi:MAG TPA: DUF4375 domain-containing protein [Bacillota bacterium]|nr:DUF4375 domain-containing protein [Bacillota bacterium]HOA90767.1 DUF4375 domain-containing protein [Bacillota bacterium]HPQ10834.1 DUF4375 domain-containing protein [Bacillota bacterium]HPT60198.1 DUF4375 domain-containing protein [Bacillota bacterium]HQD77709.1 DUF4375 domain-containing protein [Bacillota bacterium]
MGKLPMEVNSGRFDQYFLDTDGQYARDTLQFLTLIGEAEFSKLLADAIDIYESDQTDDDKYDVYSELDNSFYQLKSSVYEDLYDRCMSYVRKQVE